MSRFENIELKSDSDSDLDSEKVGTKVDNELMTKLESGSDSKKDILLILFFLYNLKVLKFSIPKNDA